MRTVVPDTAALLSVVEVVVRVAGSADPDCSRQRRRFCPPQGEGNRRSGGRPHPLPYSNGGAGIRTQGGLSPSVVFKTTPFGRSGTPPRPHCRYPPSRAGAPNSCSTGGT